MFNKLATKKAQHFIGLDIGTRYVKAILLEQDKQHIRVLALACEPIKGNAFSEREVKDYEALSQALKKVKLSLKTKVKQVVIAVSGPSVINKLAYMDSDLSDAELENQIELEADSLIPYPLEEIYLDFERLKPSTSYQGKDEVLLSAVHKDMLDSRLTLLNELGFEPKICDVEVYTLAHALIHLLAKGSLAQQSSTDTPPNSPNEAVCCISIGASQLQFCAVDGADIIYTKEHNFGLDALMQDSCANFNLTPLQYEHQLLSHSLPDTWQRDCYSLFQANLQQHITRAIQMYVNTTHQPSPQRLFICGGIAGLLTLSDDLSRDIGIDVKVFNPLAEALCDEKVTLSLNSQGPQFALAAGLAFRSLSSCHI